MFEEILNILLSKDDWHPDKVGTAKEITSMMMEFCEWLIHNTMEATTYSPMIYLKYQTKDEIIEHNGQYFDLSKEWHLSDIFQYWFDNIRNK